MIISALSAKPLSEGILKRLISRKLDTVNNMQICVGKEKDNIVVYPTDYPASMNAFLRTLSISDCIIFVVNEAISALDAEIALAVENSSVPTGMVITSETSDMESFSQFFSKYRVGAFKKIGPREDVILPHVPARAARPYVSIDKHFVVKGIGNVLIGFTLGGPIKKGDKMFLLPTAKEVTIKNIQLMDVDSTLAGPGQHVGLALNNTSESDLDLNYALCAVKDVSDTYHCELSKSKFYMGEITPSSALGCAVLGKNLSLTLSDAGGEMSVKFNKAIMKAPGKHVIADTGMASGRNRIVGSLELL